jgi:hypothetical protein
VFRPRRLRITGSSDEREPLKGEAPSRSTQKGEH